MNKKIFLVFPFLLPLIINCKSGIKSFFIKWVNYNGISLHNAYIKENETPVYPKNLSVPHKPQTKEYSYKFNGWDPAPYPATKDQTYTATYREVINYHVIYKNYDNSIIKDDDYVDIETLQEGDYPYVGNLPIKNNEGDIYYYLDGWNKVMYDDRKEVIYTAKFNNCTKDSDIDFDGLPDYLDPQPKSNEFKIRTNYDFAGVNVNLYENNFKLDYKSMFFDSDNKTFNKDIANFTISLLCDNCYDDCGRASFIENVKPNKKYDRMLERFGCDDIKDVLVVGEYELDKNDVTSYIRAKKTFPSSYNNANNDFVYLLIQNNILGEQLWLSDFDVGYNGEEYYKLTGDHEEFWKNNPDFHKGFYVSAYRAYYEKNGIRDYLMSLNNPVVLLCGISRGGAISNIISYFINNDNELKNNKVFSYNYAVPNYYAGPIDGSKANNNIFNIINKDDIVPSVPFSFWTDNKGNGFKKFGNNLYGSLSDNISLFNRKTGSSYKYITNFNEILEKTLSMNRKDVYCFIDSGLNKKFSNLVDAERKKEKYLKLLKDIGLTDEELNKYFLITINYNENDKHYYLNFKFILAGITIAINHLYFEEGKFEDYDTALEMFNYFKSTIEKLILNGLTGKEAIILPHLLCTYCIITSTLEE